MTTHRVTYQNLSGESFTTDCSAIQALWIVRGLRAQGFEASSHLIATSSEPEYRDEWADYREDQFNERSWQMGP